MDSSIAPPQSLCVFFKIQTRTPATQWRPGVHMPLMEVAFLNSLSAISLVHSGSFRLHLLQSSGQKDLLP